MTIYQIINQQLAITNLISVFFIIFVFTDMSDVSFNNASNLLTNAVDFFLSFDSINQCFQFVIYFQRDFNALSLIM